MWGMKYNHSGHLITLRTDSPNVKFCVMNEQSVDTARLFDNYVIPQQKRLLPQGTPQLPSSTDWQKPDEQFRKLFRRYKRTVVRHRRSDSNRRLTLPEVGRFLRSFLGHMADHRVSAIVSAVRGSTGTHVNFGEFVALCAANLPIVPCLDYLGPYLDADSADLGILTGSAAAKLLEQSGFKDAARRLRRDATEFVSYPHFIHLAMSSRDVTVNVCQN